MTWETPGYTEINMNSEIGAYQDEFEERTPEPPPTVGSPYGVSQKSD